MLGVILAGGFGKRLLPLTEAINKHLLPVGREPMIYHPVRKLVAAGIDKILVITGGDCADGFLTLLKDGKHLGVKQLYYAHQVGAGGIAEALKLAEGFVRDESFAVLLGDNIFSDSLEPHIHRFAQCPKEWAQIHLIEVSDPQRFGCPEFKDGKLVNIIEKPTNPPSQLAVTGIYFYPASVFTEVLPNLKPSGRGELEVTDINNYYLQQNRLNTSTLKGRWSDAGTWPSWEEANTILAGA